MAKRTTLRNLGTALAAIALIAYAGMCGLLYAAQGIVLYHPSPLLFEPDAQAIEVAGKTGPLQGWVVNPGQAEALVYFGGNGESVERDAGFFRELLPERSVYLVPYRGYGPNAGTPTEAGIEADALVVFDFVQAKHARVAVAGRSLGSGVATYVAARRPVERIALVTPYDSILNVARERYGLFPVSLLLRDRYESWRNAARISVPALVLVASDDLAIPRARSDALVANLHAAKTVVVIPHSDHNNLSNSALYASALRDFLSGPYSPQGSPAAAAQPE